MEVALEKTLIVLARAYVRTKDLCELQALYDALHEAGFGHAANSHFFWNSSPGVWHCNLYYPPNCYLVQLLLKGDFAKLEDYNNKVASREAI